MISPGFVDDALGSLIQAHVDPVPVLASVGLDYPVLRRISNEQYGNLWLAIIDTLEDEFFGLGARPMRPGSFALMCRSVLHTENLEHALRQALRFLRLVLEDPRATLVVDKDLAKIVVTDTGAIRTAFAYRTFWLIVMGVAHWIVGRRFPIRSLSFACDPPDNRLSYHQFFGTPVHFNQDQNNLIFSASYLKLPTIRDEHALKTFLKAAPANILLRYRHDSGANTKIRMRLQSTPPADWPRFEEIAKKLNLSTATLRRRLRREGHSFVSIKDDVRFVKAQKLLRETDISVFDIAIALGYSEPSAFHRAFHKWAGVSPGRFRRS